MKTMGVFFGKKRRDKKISQTELAKKLKVTTQYISNFERAVCNPSPRLYKKICKILGIHKFEIEEIAMREACAEVEEAFR